MRGGLLTAFVPSVLVGLAAAWVIAPEVSSAAFPGRNGRIVTGYVSNGSNDESDELTSFTPAGKRVRRMGLGHWPAFSPNGRLIAFDPGQDFGFFLPNGLRVAHANGAHRRRVTRGADGDPAWSPNGRAIAFDRSLDANPNEVRIYAKGKSRRLTTGSSPAWSTSNWIAFVNRGAIWAIRPNGSRLHRIVRASPEESPDWSPGGRRLVFSTLSGGIQTVRANGRGRRRIARGDEPVFSPDGGWVAFDGSKPGDTETRSICLVRPSGGKRRCVLDGDSIDTTFDGLSWQPIL